MADAPRAWQAVRAALPYRPSFTGFRRRLLTWSLGAGPRFVGDLALEVEALPGLAHGLRVALPMLAVEARCARASRPRTGRAGRGWSCMRPLHRLRPSSIGWCCIRVMKQNGSPFSKCTRPGRVKIQFMVKGKGSQSVSTRPASGWMPSLRWLGGPPAHIVPARRGAEQIAGMEGHHPVAEVARRRTRGSPGAAGRAAA